MKLPEQSKLTCKGDVPEKLATVGVDASKLNNYTVEIEAGDVELTDLLEQVAERVIALSDNAGYSPIFEQENGDGYMEQWKAEIVRSCVDQATGTAVQGRAFKQTVCANSPIDDETGLPTCTIEHFSATPKGAQKKVKVDNPFAKV